MQYSASCRLILLALLLAVSHVALANHSASHFVNELGQCELCFSQSDLKSAAVHSEHAAEPPEETDKVFSQSLTCLILHNLFQPYHSRAPPLIV